jgi:hypothetical protein
MPMDACMRIELLRAAAQNCKATTIAGPVMAVVRPYTDRLAPRTADAGGRRFEAGPSERPFAVGPVAEIGRACGTREQRGGQDRRDRHESLSAAENAADPGARQGRRSLLQASRHSRDVRDG